METLKNQRIAEYLILALLIGIGTPVCILWGFQDGQRLAGRAYVAKPTSTAVVAALNPEIFLATPANIEKGKALFQKNCTACHGENADGKGPAAIALTPPPRNFTDAAAKWTHGREPQQIFKTVSEGSEGTAMPPFAASVTEEERWALVSYIGTLPGVQNQFHPIDENLAKTLAAGGKP